MPNTIGIFICRDQNRDARIRLPPGRPLLRHLQRLLAILCAVCLAAPGGELFAQSPMLSAVRSLGIPADSGAIIVYYTPGQLTRARQIRALAEPMAAYYRTKLGVSPAVSFAVIDSASWARIPALAPFPIPFVSDSPSVAVVAVNPLPAELSAQLGQIPVTPPMPGAAAASVRALGRDPSSMRDLVMLSWDGIALHEFGHRFTEAYGIATPRRWMSEFLANYWETGFFLENLPDLARYGQAVADASPKPTATLAHTTLADFERYRQPPALSADNYQWYQDELTKRARAVYAEQGLGFLTRMRTAFPRGERPAPDDEEIVRRLETISPDWRAWMTTFGAASRQ